MPSPSNIGRAIHELEAERTHLQARLGKVDQAIATMRDLFHLPAAGESRRQPSETRHRSTNRGQSAGRGPDAIREALKGGPLKPAALAERLNVPYPQIKRQVAALIADGAIVATGVTQSRRLSLPGKLAKEAP